MAITRDNAITPLMIVRELSRLTKIGLPITAELPENGYDSMYDRQLIRVETVTTTPLRARVDYMVPRSDLLTFSLAEFSVTHLRAVAERLLTRVAEIEGPSSGSFAAAPRSVSEARSEKEGNGSLRSVRDLLVETLRAIDRGDPDYQDLRVGVLVLRRRMPDGDYSKWFAAGPDYDTITALGLITQVSISLGS